MVDYREPLVLNKYLCNVDPAVSGAGNPDAGRCVFTVQDVLAMSGRIHPFVYGETCNVPNSLANEEVFADAFPMTQSGAFGAYFHRVAISVPMVKEAIAAHL